MKYTWNTSDECEIEVMDREILAEYHSRGYYTEGNYDNPPEGESIVSGITVFWCDPEGNINFTMEEGDRNWKRMDKFCPDFINGIYEEVENHDHYAERW